VYYRTQRSVYSIDRIYVFCHARRYMCGPTVYDAAHLGHARYGPTEAAVLATVIVHGPESTWPIIYIAQASDMQRLVNG